jgi:hypothetical protein
MVSRGNPVPNSAAVVRRESLLALGGITEDFHSVEDFDTWLRLAEADGVFRYVKDTLGSYAITDSNISKFSLKQLLRQRALFERHIPLVPGELRPIAESFFAYLIGSYALRLGMNRMADRYLSQVRFSASPPRWVKSTGKRFLLRTPAGQLFHD